MKCKIPFDFYIHIHTHFKYTNSKMFKRIQCKIQIKHIDFNIQSLAEL